MMEDCCSDKYTFTDEGSEVKITIDDLSVYTGFQYWLDTTDEYDEIKALDGEARLLKFKEYYQSQVDSATCPYQICWNFFRLLFWFDD